MEPDNQTENPVVRKSEFSPKLTDEERIQACEWLGQWKPARLVQNLIKKQFGKELTVQSIYGYAKTAKWKSLIERCRQAWVSGVAEVPIAHTRYRLEKLQQLLEEIEANPDLSEEKKEWRILRVLDRARLEMEETKTNFTNLFLTQVNQMSDEELLKRRDELLRRVGQSKFPVRKIKTVDAQPAQAETM